MERKDSDTSNNPVSYSVSPLHYINARQVLDLVDHAKNQRNKIMLLILFETGCTVNELANIRIRDIETDSINFIASITRNSEAKESKISKGLADMIAAYLKQKEPIGKTSYLFEARLNKKITTKRIRQIVQDLGSSIGQDVNPQTLRYSHIVHALKKAITLNDISSQTGIKKSRLVQLLTDLELPTNKDAYERFHDYT